MPGIGEAHDVVTLRLGGDDVHFGESYDIQFGLLSQPGAFSMRLGRGDAVKGLIKKYPPKTKFELHMDGGLVMSGLTDGYTVSDSGGASEFTVRGRDGLAVLHDAYMRSEQSFTDITFADLTKRCLDATVGAGNYKLIYSNNENRKAVTQAPETAGKQADLVGAIVNAAIGATAAAQLPNLGVALGAVNKQLEAALVDLQSQDAVEPAPTAQRTIQGKLGQRWGQNLLLPELARAGIFLWQTSTLNTFILSTADITQRPTFRLTRKRGSPANEINVLSASFKNETTPRFSSCEIHFRRGGGAEGRGRGYGFFQDDEMVALGYDRPLVHKDDRCKTLAQADFLAKRKICESQRAGFVLEYTVAGHTTPWVQGPGRVVWFFDTLVEVEDDEYGINDTFYIESVQMQGNPQKTTTLRLMKTSAAAFGDLED